VLVGSIVILMIEEEQPEGLSARKLVVETAKHNVLTAYNAKDGLELARRFPKVDAIMVHARLLERTPDLLEQTKSLCPGKPVILASPYPDDGRPEADYVVDSHRPHDLVKLLNSGELRA
jgi:response regulator RpfG family c-di-GMP phosphodiesterase